MDADDRLRLDYEETTQLLRTLVDVRFKLLAFVPTIAGAAVGLFGRPRPAVELLGLGLLGLVATLGVFLYELRNTQLHDALVHRAKELESQLGLPSALGAPGPGGLFSERPRRTVRLVGLVPAAHDRGLALVYGAALGGWSYLVGWGALRGLEIDAAQNAGAVIGALAGLLVVAEVERIDRRQDKAGAPPKTRTVAGEQAEPAA
jgi:hypothetical protein